MSSGCRRRPLRGLVAALEQPTHKGGGDRGAEELRGEEAGASPGARPEKVSLSERAMVTAGLANEVEAVNQWIPPFDRC